MSFNKEKFTDKLARYGAGIGLLCASFIIYAIAQYFYIVPKKSQLGIGSYLTTILVTVVVAYLIGFIYIRFKANNSWGFIYPTDIKNAFKFNWKYVGLCLLGIIAILLIQITASVLNHAATSTNQADIESLQAQGLPLLKVMLVVVSPIFEELIFRGIFFNYFFNQKSRKNMILGIIVSGLMFGIVHEPTLKLDSYFLMYSACGMVLADIYLKTKNIKYNIITHFGNNLLSLLLGSI